MGRSREAWLTALTAALGLAEGCHHDAAVATDAAVIPAAASTPSASESVVTVAASAAPSASVVPSASVTQRAPPILNATSTASVGVPMIGAACGARVQTNANPLVPGSGIGIGNLHAACGAPGYRPDAVQPPTANVAVTGGTSDADPRTLAIMKPGLRACANRGLQVDPTEAGTLHATLSVSATGEVTAVDGVTSSGLGQGTQACMVQRMRHAQFTAAPEHKVPVVIRTVKQP